MQRHLQLLALLLAATLTTACTATDTRRSAGEQIDDTVLLSRVKSALVANKDTDGLDIDVEVFRSRVQLNGFADTEEAKTAAGRVAAGVRGVTEVDNNLVVREGGSRRVGEYIDDKTLKARVATALARADDVSAMAVEVEVDRGVVSLGGFVSSDDERRRAAEIAATVDNVERVINNISVRSR